MTSSLYENCFDNCRCRTTSLREQTSPPKEFYHSRCCKCWTAYPTTTTAAAAEGLCDAISCWSRNDSGVGRDCLVWKEGGMMSPREPPSLARGRDIIILDEGS